MGDQLPADGGAMECVDSIHLVRPVQPAASLPNPVAIAGPVFMEHVRPSAAGPLATEVLVVWQSGRGDIAYVPTYHKDAQQIAKIIAAALAATGYAE